MNPAVIYGGVIAWIVAPPVAGLFAWRYLQSRPRRVRIAGTMTCVTAVFALLGFGLSYLTVVLPHHDLDAEAVAALTHSLELDKVSAGDPELRQRVLDALSHEAIERTLNPSAIHKVFVDLVAPVAMKAPRENIIGYGVALRNLIAVLAQTTPDSCMQFLTGSYAEQPPKAALPQINELGQAISAAYQAGKDHPSVTIAAAADVISAEDAAEIAERVYALTTNPFTEDEIKHAKEATGASGERCLLELKFYTNLLNMSEDDQENLLRAILVQ